MTTKPKKICIHPFELAGLGLAPFRFAGYRENVHKCGDHVKAGGSCDYCGTGIRYECFIQSHDGKIFKVGTDCVLKLQREDNRLINEMERARALFLRQKKAKEHAAKEAARLAARLARDEAERAANGGLTNRELEQKQKADAEAAQRDTARAAHEANNAWLIAVLKEQHQGDFIVSMIDQLTHKAIESLTPRVQEILFDIHGRAAGRYGSKKRIEADRLFCQKLGWEYEGR
jgi:hypothetical protein